jgi:hypothetical protein
VTAQCWAALHLDPKSKAAAEKAERYVREHGGMDALLAAMGSGDVSPISLALVSLLAPERLPCPPAIWALSDHVVDPLAKRVHFGFIMGALQLDDREAAERAFGRDGTKRLFLERRECARDRADVPLPERRRELELEHRADGDGDPRAVAAGLPTSDPRVERAQSDGCGLGRSRRRTASGSMSSRATSGPPRSTRAR